MADFCHLCLLLLFLQFLFFFFFSNLIGRIQRRFIHFANVSWTLALHTVRNLV